MSKRARVPQIVMFFVLLLTAVACKDEHEGYFWTSYNDYFTAPFEASEKGPRGYDLFKHRNINLQPEDYNHITIKGENAYGHENSIKFMIAGDWCYKGPQFEEYLRKYGDTGYWEKKKSPGYLGDSSAAGALGEYITDINIVTVDDFDENHPAGSSLNDIMEFEWVSFYEFIQSGYTDHNFKCCFRAPLSDKSIYPIKMACQNPLAYQYLYFSDAAKPAKGKEIEIRVKFTFETCESEESLYVTF